MILHAIDKNAISLKKGKKYLVLVTYLPENFEIQQNTIIFVEIITEGHIYHSYIQDNKMGYKIRRQS